MTGFQRILPLLLISSLFTVYSTYSADSADMLTYCNMAGSGLYKMAGDSQILEALKEYTCGTPELISGKLFSVASLVVPLAVYSLSKKSRYASYALWLTSLASLVPMYATYEVGNDMSLIRNIQLAQTGEKVEDEHIRRYMRALLDIDNRPHSSEEFQSLLGGTKFKFEDGDTRMALLWKVIKEYGKHECNANQLKKCAREVLISKGFKFPSELVDREYNEVDFTIKKEMNSIEYHFYYKWCDLVEMLVQMLDNNSHKKSFESLRVSGHSSGNTIEIINKLHEKLDLKIVTNTFNHEDRLKEFVSKAKVGEEVDDDTVKLCIRSLLYSFTLDDVRLYVEEGDNYVTEFDRLRWDKNPYATKKARLRLKHREFLANHYVENADQIRDCAYQVLNDLELIETSNDRIYIRTKSSFELPEGKLRFINIMLHALLEGQNSKISEGEERCIAMTDNFHEVKIFKNSHLYSVLETRYLRDKYDVSHLFNDIKKRGCCIKNAKK